MPDKIIVTDELEDSLKLILKSCEDEDREIRKSMIRSWKKNEEFWKGVQYLFWDETNETWKSPIDVSWGSDDSEDSDQIGSFSDKVVDIFKAHGEAIIAALSAQIPAIRFIPDDADDPDDVRTARTKTKIADLVSRHNKVKLIFLRALYYLALQGIVASYRYKDSDSKYGTYKVPVYGTQPKETTLYTCPECNYQSEQEWEGPCPQCGQIVKPEEDTSTQEVPVIKSVEDRPKTRAKLDVYGPLHFKISHFARNQSETPYFVLYGDISKDIVQDEYPDYYDDLASERAENLDRFSRTNFSAPSDPIEDAKYLATVKKVWLRPAAFNRETDETKRKDLYKKFPKGCRFTVIGKTNIFIKEDLAEEALDDRWTIGQAGLSTYIHSDPILRPLIQIQEMRNQLVNLIVETINHGIPSMFADPAVINFDIYGKYEALPGFIYQAKPAMRGGKIGDSFYTSDRATLSKEVSLFLNQLDKDAQFCVGSFPSIYGGPSEGKSRTLGEYEASRKMALQRLSIVWSLIVEWWITTMEGLVNMYAECVIEDERFTKYENGNYINVWIKMADMQGKTGGVEAEASENFPVSLAQKQALFTKLLEMNNPTVNQVLFNPENARVVQEWFALTELKIPGEAQRFKQCSELQDLIKAGAEGQDPTATGQSAVPIDPNVDDHAVHIAVCDGFSVDSVGLDLKKFQPASYAQIQAHRAEHQVALLIKTKSNVETPPGVPPETTQVGADE